MLQKKYLCLILCLFLCLFRNVARINAAEKIAQRDYHTVKDSRGAIVKIPKQIHRVVTISDGLVEGVMTILGVEKAIVALGSRALQRVWSYTYETKDGAEFTYEDGMNPVLYLNPWFKNLPLIADDPGINYEALAALNPDLVIIRFGSCNLQTNDERVQLTIRTIESLDIPLIVLYGTHFYEKPNIATIRDEISIIGTVFNRPKEAGGIAEFIEKQVGIVRKRTRSIPEKEKPTVLIFGPSPSARKKGGVGQVFGIDTIESFFIQDIVNAKNAFQDSGYFRIISTEQLLSLDPQVLILCTAAGYHPPRELYEAPYYQHLTGMDAIKKRRVYALAWTPWNCAKRLEYPIDVMVIAKGAYPEKFKDIDLGEWLLDFYQGLYGVDRETARGLRSCQWMDWVSGKIPDPENRNKGR